MYNIPNEINQLEKITKPPEVIIYKDNLNIYVYSGLGFSLEIIKPYQKRIPLKNKRKETLDVSIIRK